MFAFVSIQSIQITIEYWKGFKLMHKKNPIVQRTPNNF